jgi:hypothetical protein
MPVTLLSVGEAAQRYQLRPARLQTLIRDGRIRTVRLEGQDLIPDEDVAMVTGQVREENGNDRWIPLAEAVALHPEVDEGVLRKLIKDGVVPSKATPDSSGPSVDRYELADVVQKLDRSQWQHLEGRGISINAAGRTYDLDPTSLRNWALAGHIRILGRDDYRVYLDEADVRFAAALASIAGKQGRPLFPTCY